MTNTSFRIAKELYDKGICLYRGINTKIDSFIQNPKERRSTAEKEKRNGNMVNRMVSEVLPSWSLYPRRTHCICLTTSITIAAGYGKVFSAFPNDDTLLAVAPTKDFWFSFDEDRKSNINFMGEVFGLINEKCFQNSFNLDLAGDINSFFFGIDSLPNKKQILLSNEIINLLPPIMDDKPFHFLDGLARAESTKNFVEKYLHPDTHGFKLHELNSKLDFLKGEYREIWTENPCLMVRHEFAWEKIERIEEERR